MKHPTIFRAFLLLSLGGSVFALAQASAQEDFTLTRDDYLQRRIGFQSYTGRGGCLLPAK